MLYTVTLTPVSFLSLRFAKLCDFVVFDFIVESLTTPHTHRASRAHTNAATVPCCLPPKRPGAPHVPCRESTASVRSTHPMTQTPDSPPALTKHRLAQQLGMCMLHANRCQLCHLHIFDLISTFASAFVGTSAYSSRESVACASSWMRRGPSCAARRWRSL